MALARVLIARGLMEDVDDNTHWRFSPDRGARELWAAIKARSQIPSKGQRRKSRESRAQAEKEAPASRPARLALMKAAVTNVEALALAPASGVDVGDECPLRAAVISRRPHCDGQSTVLEIAAGAGSRDCFSFAPNSLHLPVTPER